MYIPPFEKLQTKNKDDILKEINSTKRRMACLKIKMEHPFYKEQERFCPSDLTIFKCDRDYLNRAILEYISLGGEYKQGALEKRDSEFNEKINKITKITLTKGGFFSPREKIVVDLSCDKPRYFRGLIYELFEKEVDYTKQEFLSQLERLHIGEWRKSYYPNRFGVSVLDGEEWVLNIEYSDGKKAKYGGQNAYPYNYEELIGLLDM